MRLPKRNFLLVEASASTSSEASARMRKAPTANSRRGPRTAMASTPEQQGGKNEIEHQHQQRGVDHSAGGGQRGALDGGLGMETFVGGDQRADAAEHGRLQQGHAEVV